MTGHAHLGWSINEDAPVLRAHLQHQHDIQLDDDAAPDAMASLHETLHEVHA